MLKITSLIFILLHLSSIQTQNIFSSLSNMKSLPSIQSNLLIQLETILNKETNDLQTLMKIQKQLKTLNYKKIQKNKIHLFVFINKLLTMKKYLKPNYKLELKTSALPNEQDFGGGVFSLIVLMMTYNIPIEEVINGHIRNETTTLDLDIKLYIIRKYYALSDSHIHPIRILHQTVHDIDHTNAHKYSLVAEFYKDILEKLYPNHAQYVISFYSFILNCLKANNLFFYDIFVQVHAGNIERDKKSVDKIDKNAIENFQFEKIKSKWNPYKKEKHVRISLKQFRHSSALCRGERNAPEDKRLKCFYSTGDKVENLFEPLKIEQLNLDPLIVVYREFLHGETEIKAIIDAAVPLLRKSKIGVDGQSYDSIIRISHVAWFYDEDLLANPKLARIARKIIRAVPLENVAEGLQVNNYGIGGLYTPHLDNVYQNGNEDQDWDRLATFMMYLSSVNGSGATIFTYLNLTVFPSKGDAIFWYNLYSNGVTDPRTVHSGCPVLIGEKWVANKWYSNEDQWRKYPCKAQENVMDMNELKTTFPHF